MKKPGQTEKEFSPSTTYADYPINRELMHWESQANTAQHHTDGQNLIHHQERGYCADIIVNGFVILELKTVESLRSEHFAQLTNYLKATDKEVGLLLNFGRKPGFKRILLTNDKKRFHTDLTD